MRRSVLNPNAILKGKYRFVVRGLEEANECLSVGDIESEVSAVEREDKTKVTGGRTGGGETDVVLDLASDTSRNAYLGWHKQCIDKAGGTADDGITIPAAEINGPAIGVSHEYKREAMIIYHRLYNDPNTEEQPVKIRLVGAWARKISFSGVEMNSEDAAQATITICYDDVQFL